MKKAILIAIVLALVICTVAWTQGGPSTTEPPTVGPGAPGGHGGHGGFGGHFGGPGGPAGGSMDNPGGPAGGHGGFGGPGGFRGPGAMGACPAMSVNIPQLARVADLQLTDDQKTKIKAIMTQNETDMAALAKKSADASKALREAMFATNFDQNNVKNLAAAAEKAEAAIIDAKISAWTQIRAILTADQITKLQDMMKPQPRKTTPEGPSGSEPTTVGPPAMPTE